MCKVPNSKIGRWRETVGDSKHFCRIRRKEAHKSLGNRLKVSLDILWQDVLKKKPQDSWAHKA